MALIETSDIGAESDTMSKRGFLNVKAILPKISAQVAERTKTHDLKIDLSTSENCLLRPELMAIYQKAINENLETKVHP